MTRTFIYGSCVCRDTFEFLDRGRFSLLHYVARSSLVSVFGSPTSLSLPSDHGLSPFQLRQVESDASSALLPLLRDAAGQIDLLLWDLIDERLGFYEDADGHVVTDSIELRRAGAFKRLDGYQHRTFGSDEHYNRFRGALTEWSDFLTEHGLLDRTIILAPPWARKDEMGAPAPASFGITGVRGNALYDRYYSAVEKVIGGRLIGRDLEGRTDTTHKWGPAPFHYTRETYLAMCRTLVDVTS